MVRSFSQSILIMCLLSVSSTTVAKAQAPAQTFPRQMTALPSGVKFPTAESNAARWNRTVLLSDSKIASGDIDKLSPSVRDAATAFSLILLATVTPPANPGDGYVLREVGVGYTVPINGVPTVVTEETANELGAGLGFISRKILGSSQEQLTDVKIIFQSTTLLLFDTPSIMLRGTNHAKYITRHMVWIDPQTGQGATIAWLLGNDAQGKLTPVNEPLRLFAMGSKETRRIHVDGNEFSFIGFPTEKAFALEDLPPGKKVPWSRELAALAKLPSYDNDLVRQLSVAMTAAIEAAPSVDVASE